METTHYTKYSTEFKVSAVERYKASGVSIRAFAEQNGIALSTFESWMAKVRRGALAAAEPAPGRLIDITDAVVGEGAEGSGAASIEITVGGATIKAPAAMLAEAIRALRL